MPRKPIGEKAMTDAERQARYRVARAADAPVTRARRLADHRSRARRWQDAVAQLIELQAQYADWLEALPANQHDSALAEAPPGYLRTRSLRTRERGAPTRLRTRLTLQRRTLKTSQRVAPSGSQEPDEARVSCPVVCPAKAGMFRRKRPAGARIRGPVVWIAGWRETKTLKPIDTVSRGDVSLHVGFGGRLSEDAGVGVNERQALTLKGGEGRTHGGRVLVKFRIH